MRDPLILPLTLTGWRHSIHTAIVRLTLAEKGVAARFTEVDPFRTPDAAGLSPFGMVPVLRQGDFTLYETGAICRWIDEGFPGPALQPGDPKARARMVQTIAIMDAHGFRPMLRDHYGAGVFALAEGEPPDPARVSAGLRAAMPVLAALEVIAAEGLVMSGPLTLADLHLAPMFAGFTRSPDGAAAVAGFPALHSWWQRQAKRPHLATCLAPLPDHKPGPAISNGI
ncbi:glutathione S-transferase family protein [Paracoccus sp. IB05]|uniref:glutathione S-transferase family protein n=1 Tax=Paracoccus sp. IB05 TaxID=2779367 RepID=UPI0018E81D78|nr:glutathione S-transferase family protein [Paracoccus sp. IB05]MBJ2153612.1 glutathione S-transferase family protein [Paracoccus sp. IB05]